MRGWRLVPPLFRLECAEREIESHPFFFFAFFISQKFSRMRKEEVNSQAAFRSDGPSLDMVSIAAYYMTVMY